MFHSKKGLFGLAKFSHLAQFPQCTEHAVYDIRRNVLNIMLHIASSSFITERKPKEN